MSKKNDFSSLDLISAYTEKKKNPSRIDLSNIFVNPNQPRVFNREEVQDLVDSMDRLGLIEPILLRKDKNKYIVVAGERRFRAASKLGWKDIPAIVTDANEEICYEMALAENEKRKNLNPWEVGRSIAYLRKEKKKTAEEVAALLGYTERYVKQLSSIARLDQKAVFDMIRTGTQVTVKSLEAVLKRKEGRGETISPQKKTNNVKVTLDLSVLPSKTRENFIKDLNTLKKKYGIQV
ncbi:ParB/RepB/Spo0J family partition protein [Leptospira sp. GIMC2001]|uniref:ParB/RepB/Spo0J family partition protein n=1 Tax=Leptospira sp. GIMC2001 TaxID=1513297 RepID=UPI00234BD0D7|nr:ParB/RepB/Spo0J family partition protein [Leptospira sp. GIMC2001]WCL47709.1 ParB/RepB/Spo0J family partition protein [Leptospira sp. GIMC2001]